MQLTRFDRWLRERYVYETLIYTLSEPAKLPKGIQKSSKDLGPASHYNHLFITHDASAADELIQQLRANNQKFSTRIVDRDKWYVPLIAPKGKSVTWSFMWLIIGAISSTVITHLVIKILSSAEMKRILAESWKMITSG
ncbi:hypothetical protein JIN85_09220 [Luteolibacter pohnpeiensis]|uniref:Uncharacterized protein n=1 Tax=Luteolibacter pohnpeiensis TaxID=454153 RepID=A0A934S3P3_9BACT|nr:hypothetical protein [Luteolibacter pohnpeiensis]MBK1882595.1 hypothetical protein [Luteolibacter pohnpeiensis]